MTERDTWDGLVASTNQALEWGITLAGALADRHAEGEVVDTIDPTTIVRPRFGPPALPAAADGPWADSGPDRDCEAGQRQDVADLAAAILAIVADPPPEVRAALVPAPDTALELGERLQDAQRLLGLPVAPIDFAGAANDDIGGTPVEVPPPGVDPIDQPAPAGPVAAATVDGDVPDDSVADRRFDPEELARQPDLRLLGVLVVAMLVVAVVIGIGWR